MPLDRRSINRNKLLWVACTTVLLFLLCFLLLGRLGEVYIADYDEARHGVSAYEMIRNNDYLVNTYQGEPDYWNLKPPMSFWLISLAYRLFGYNAFALRFFSAMATLLSACAIALWAWRENGRWAVPFIFMIFVANNVIYGLHFARYGDADSQYQFFFTIAMLGALLCDRDLRWIYISGFFFGLAFLTKGLHAVTIPITCFLILLANGQIKKMRLKHYLLVLASGLIVIVPWAAARYLRDGTAFFSGMLSTDVADRFGAVADPLDADVPTFLYYLTPFTRSPAMLICVGLCLVSIFTLIVTRHPISAARRHAAIGSLLWVVVPIILYTLANVKFRWYVYSCLMGMPVLTVTLVYSALEAVSFRKLMIICLSVAFAGFAFPAYRNVQNVLSTKFSQTIQGFLKEDLDRDLDEGMHAYIQYSENQQTTWMQGSILTAEMYGDVVCLNGGIEGYLSDEESSILYISKDNNTNEITQLQQNEIVRNENYYLIAFEK